MIACGAIAREILAVTRINNLDHIDLHCLPAIYHSYPQKIAPALEEAIANARARGFETIFIGYADCGTGGDIDKICEREGIERLSGPHCYSFFSGNEAFAAREDDITSFFLTDFLARQFEAFVIVPLGLDRHPELRDMYFGNYRKVVYLSQEEDPALQERRKPRPPFSAWTTNIASPAMAISRVNCWLSDYDIPSHIAACGLLRYRHAGHHRRR